MTTPAKIKPWITETAAYIQAVYNLPPEAVPCITKIIANDIAAHAPKQEPRVPLSRLQSDVHYFRQCAATATAAGKTDESDAWNCAADLVGWELRQAEERK